MIASLMHGVITSTLELVTIDRHTVEVKFDLTKGDYVYPMVAFNDIARAICKVNPMDKRLSVRCEVACWKQGVLIPNTEEIVVDETGHQVLVTGVQFAITEINWG